MTTLSIRASSPHASFKLFGLSMHRRSTRRKLVAASYTLLALIFAAAWALVHVHPVSWAYAFYATLAVSLLVFGGQGHRGLIKGFLNKPPRPAADRSDVVTIGLETRPSAIEISAWKNDERELSRRDRAHYHAYQPLSIGFVVITILAAWAMHPPRFLSAAVLLNGIFAVALLSTMLAITLPAAIILWTEPDIDSI